MAAPKVAEELVKTEVLDLYRDKCKTSGVTPHRAFVRYLEETYDENESLEVIIQGNDKLNFTNRVDDKVLLVIEKILASPSIFSKAINL